MCFLKDIAEVCRAAPKKSGIRKHRLPLRRSGRIWVCRYQRLAGRSGLRGSRFTIGRIRTSESGLQSAVRNHGTHGLPRRIKVDNELALISRRRRSSCALASLSPGDSRPCSPPDNSHIESFNSSFRNECLRIRRLISLENASDQTACRRRDSSEFCPHCKRTDLTQMQFFESRTSIRY